MDGTHGAGTLRGNIEARVIDHVNNLKLQHLVELSKLGDRCAEIEEEIEGWLAEHDVVFAGSTIPFVLMPHFVSPGQLRRVKRAVACLSQVLDRFCDAYAEDERLRDELAVPPAEDALIRLDPGFSRPLKICRLDAFLQGYDVKFLEFNADSPAGIGYTDVLHEGLRRAIDLPRVNAEFETAYTPMLPGAGRDAARPPTASCAASARTCPRHRAWPSWTWRVAPRCPSSGSSARRRRQPASRRSTPRSTR